MSTEETRHLERLAASEHRVAALRAKIVLLDAEGRTGRAIAEELGVAPLTVYKWRSRYVAIGIEGLRDRPRPGQPRKLGPDDERSLVSRARNTLPPDGIAWSTRGLSRAEAVTQHQVRASWKRAGIEAERIVRAIDDALLWIRAEPMPLALVFIPPHGAIVFETRGFEAPHALDRRQSFRLSTLRRRRHRASSLYALCESFPREIGRSASDAARVASVVRTCLEAAPRGRALHLLLSGEEARTACGSLWSSHGVRPCVVQTMPTLDAWVAALESMWLALEHTGTREGDSVDRLVSLRTAFERHVRSFREGVVRSDAFLWHASDAFREEREARESGFFAKRGARQAVEER